MPAHRLVMFDRGQVHVHRYRAGCTCGWWGPNRRRKQDAVRMFRSHVGMMDHAARTARYAKGPRPVTRADRLPDALRLHV